MQKSGVLSSMEKKDTKKLLFDTALSLFRERGCENVTIQQICKAAGTTRNAFYYHYTSKEDLLCSYFECLPFSENELFSNLLNQSDEWELLLYVYEIHTRMVIQEGKDFVRHLSIACTQNKKSLFSHYGTTTSYGTVLIQKCKEKGLISSPLAAEDLSYLARTVSNASVRKWSISGDDFDVIAHTRLRLTQLLRPELACDGE